MKKIKQLPLTAVEDKIFVYIRNTILATGYSPTRAEIAEAMRFKDNGPGRVESYLQNIGKKGYIYFTRRGWRNIRIKRGK